MGKINLAQFRIAVRLLISVVGFTSLMNAPAALAAQWSVAGSFNIVQGEKFCLATTDKGMQAQSDVQLSLAVGDDDKVVIMLSSFYWSVVKGIKYPGMSFSIDGYIYSENKSDTVSSTETISRYFEKKNGLTHGVGRNFLDSFAKGSDLLVKQSDTVIAHFNIKGGKKAVEALAQCVTALKARNEKQRAEGQKASVDPFEIATVIPEPNKAARPANSQRYWTQMVDYPQEIAREQQGTVGYKLEITTLGRVAKCEVVQSSGWATLDDLTCSKIIDRSRFFPATDDKGDPTTGSYENSVTWAFTPYDQ